MELETSSSNRQSQITVPIAIIVAGALIGGAIFLSRTPGAAILKNEQDEPQVASDFAPNVAEPSALSIRPIDGNDHIRGNPDAPIIVVEYSDTECPFCRIFHETMRKVIDEYGKSGKVAWIYRHLPIVQLHSKAPKEAEALECAAEIGGNLKFWEYADRLFSITPSNDRLDQAELPRIAEFVGLNSALWQSCYESGKYASRVEQDRKNGEEAGSNGTPYSVLALKNKVSESATQKILTMNVDMLKRLPPGSDDPLKISVDGIRVSVGGAFPLPTLKEIIESILK